MDIFYGQMIGLENPVFTSNIWRKFEFVLASKRLCRSAWKWDGKPLIIDKVNQSLLKRAHDIEEWAEEHFIDPAGIVYTYLDADTAGPLTDAFFKPGQEPLVAEGCTPAEWHNHENCSMATAAYMMGLLYRYTVEKDPVALARARRCFQALRYIYEMGKQLEEGFMPKIYGNRFSEETSSDQVLYAMLALDYYHQYATAAEQPEISRMITQMINFWVKRGYRYTYFWEKDMLWPLGRFTNLLLMGYKHSGNELFMSEYRRLLDMGVNREPLESRLQPKLKGEWPPTEYEKRHHAWLIGEVDGAVSMDVMELDYLLANDPENSWAEHWRQSLRTMWKEAKLVIAPDGMEYTQVLVDMDTLRPRRPDPEIFRSHDDPRTGMVAWIGFRHASGTRSCNSTFLARAGVQAYAHLRDPDMASTARHILQGIDIGNMFSYYDADRFPPELQHRAKLYSGDGISNWLWGYWLGRCDDAFPE